MRLAIKIIVKENGDPQTKQTGREYEKFTIIEHKDNKHHNCFILKNKDKLLLSTFTIILEFCVQLFHVPPLNNVFS